MRVGILSALACLALSGCGPRPDVDADGNPVVPAESADAGEEGGDGFEIQWPGGSVKVGKDGGVDVKAPGVDVNTKPGGDVRVKAGGVDVDVNRGDDSATGNEPDGEDSAQLELNRNHLFADAGSSDALQFVSHKLIVEVPGFSSQKKTLDSIPPGTRFVDDPPEGWTNIIAFVDGKLTDGDVEDVSSMVKKYASMFNLVKLANVVRADDGSFVLDKVAIGFSTKIEGVNTVVTSKTEGKLGGNLGMIGRSVLDGNIESLEKVKQVARNKTSMVIDAPAIMLRDGEHKEMVVRYFIWVSPNNGQLGTVTWLLDEDPSSGATAEKYAIADDTIQYLPPNFKEERKMNVKAEKFNLFGVPAKDAFALVQLPQGRAYSYTSDLKEVACLRNFDQQSYMSLLTAMAQALAAR